MKAQGIDPRAPLLGVAAWMGALAAGRSDPRLVAVAAVSAAGVAGASVLVLARGRRSGGWGRRPGWVAAVLLVLAASLVTTTLHRAHVADNPVAELAAERAAVTVVGTMATDPTPVQGRFGDQVVTRVVVHRVEGRGRAHTLAVAVLVVGGPGWQHVGLGATVRVSGLLSVADDPDLAGVLRSGRDPEVLAQPSVWWRASAAVRASLRESVAHRPLEQRALVPALVDGDDGGLPLDVEDDFRTTGLTHLLAVSGTNLTLVVGFLLVVARWCRVRGRWLVLVGAAGVVGFVLLARTEPSVLRAAVMGTIALVGMGSDGQRRGARALGVAVLVLVLLDPPLATSPGFALSVLATAGILVLAPVWRDALARWMPRWLAEAVAVPAAAQLACTPLVAALSGQVSLVAVLANLLVAPAVGPATVLGLLGGLVGLVWMPIGRVVGTLASWCVAWILAVARHGAALPTAAVGWGQGAAALALLTVLCAVVALGAHRLLRRPVVGLVVLLMVLAAAVVRMPTPGWPPDGWVLVACDVGQGDALVVRTGPGAAIVVDAGPDPRPVERCLDDLGVHRVPLLVLTHFHADHIDGLDGVFDGRRVDALETTRVLDPPEGVEEVDEEARSEGISMAVAPYAVTRRIGEATVQVLAPVPGPMTAGAGDGSSANDASVVLLVEVRGVRLLLTGDVEPPTQQAMARAWPGLHVDVLKVPHHGSRHQDLPWLESLGASYAVVSVGADNDYGHPAREVLDPLADTGAEVLRTDQDGAVAIVVRDGHPESRTQH